MRSMSRDAQVGQIRHAHGIRRAFFNINLFENDIPGASFGDRTCDEYTMVQLQRRLECRGLKTNLNSLKCL